MNILKCGQTNEAFGSSIVSKMKAKVTCESLNNKSCVIFFSSNLFYARRSILSFEWRMIEIIAMSQLRARMWDSLQWEWRREEKKEKGRIEPHITYYMARITAFITSIDELIPLIISHYYNLICKTLAQK